MSPLGSCVQGEDVGVGGVVSSAVVAVAGGGGVRVVIELDGEGEAGDVMGAVGVGDRGRREMRQM